MSQSKHSSSSSNKRRKQNSNSVGSLPASYSDGSNPAVRNLLSQLAMAQGIAASTTSNTATSDNRDSAPSTSRSQPQSKSSKKNAKKPDIVKNEKPAAVHTQTTRTKGSTVAARMSKKGPPPTQEYKPFGNGGRPRNNNNSVYRQMQTPMKPGPSGTNSQRYGPPIPDEILEELCFRFLLNIPEDEQRNQVRICFQIELALWFFVDFYCKVDSKNYRQDCMELGMREFTRQIFNKCDFLCEYAECVDEVVDMWRHYKSNVPTYGAILLDSSLENVLLVQGYYSSKNSWGFPKGKVNESEHPRVCAIREVKEEVGYDFGIDRPKGNEPKIQKFINETMVRLYIVTEVPMDYKFEPMTRNEIRKIQWFNVSELPIDKNDQVALHNNKVSNNNFYTVIPFVQDLQNWIYRERERRSRALHKNGPQGKVAKINSERQSAFTPVAPKTANEKMTSAMTLLKQSSSGTNLSQRGEFSRNGSDTMFRPVPTDGHAFLQMLSGGAPAPPSSSKVQKATSIAHPTPIKPKIDKPVYEAPREAQKPKSNAKQDTTKQSEVSSSTVFTTASVSEIENDLQKLLMKETITVTQEVQEEVERDTDTGSSSSVVMANELPMVAAIELAEVQQAAFEKRQQAVEDHLQMIRTAQEQITIQALEHLVGQFSPGRQPTIEQLAAHELARRQRQHYASQMTSRSREQVVQQDEAHPLRTSGLGLIKLCESWKNFKLDTSVILAGLPLQ